MDDQQLGTWVLDALATSSDLVLVADAETTIVWCNQASFPLLGHHPDAVVGRSFADFLHPDDLGRAAEVLALTAAGAFDTFPITPALYRARMITGDWVNLEINASPGRDGSMLIVARVGGDLVLTDRILEAMSGDEPFDQQVALVMELGQWRHPSEGYAIFYRDDHGALRSATANLPAVLGQAGEVPGEATPWDAAWAAGADDELVVEDLPRLDDDHPVVGPTLAAAARAHGFEGCLASVVPDPSGLGDACIVIWTAIGGPTTSGHRYALGNMRRAFRLVLQQRAQVRGLERAARIDHLTGLTSRARFLDQLAEVGAERAGQGHAVLYIDLDGFKAVNDRRGHAAGDEILTATARRIGEVVADEALVARLGGDEFVVLCAAGTTEDEAAEVAQAVIDAVAAPIDLDGDAVTIGASVGLAVGGPDHDPQTVLDAADAALLVAKAEGRGRWRRGTLA